MVCSRNNILHLDETVLKAHSYIRGQFKKAIQLERKREREPIIQTVLHVAIETEEDP